MNVIMYGIPNCDTIKKARKWLEQAGIDYQFHDYRKQGVDEALIQQFFHQLDWQQVVNKRGTTYRQLTPEQKDALTAETAAPLLVENPAMIKRPILQVNDQLHLGFKADQYAALFS